MPKQANEQANAARAMQDGASGSKNDKEVVAKKYDEKAAAERMTKLNEELAKRNATAAKAEEALQSVVIPGGEATIARVATQLGFSIPEAKRRLQEMKGDERAVYEDFLVKGRIAAIPKAVLN